MSAGPGLAALAALLLAAAPPAAAAPRVLDAFEDSSPWTAMPASGVAMKLSTEPGPAGRCLRVDFDFQKGGGYAVLHRALELELPGNYRFTVRVRGATAPQNLEFKLLDASGENVWWTNRRDFAFPAEWTTLATKKRHIEFAWGPAGGGEMRRVAAIEFAITAGSGGRGTVWFDELSFEELPPPGATPPPIAARASSAARGGDAARAVDGDSTTAWRSRRGDPRPWIELDLGEEREFGGLALDWAGGAHPRDYAVRVAAADGAWRTVREVRGTNGGRDWLRLPESEARRVRIEAAGPRSGGVALLGVEVLPIETGAMANRFLEAVARRAPRGLYPRGVRGELQFWTVVGTPGGDAEGYFTEDGAVDLGIGMPSLEPFLWADGRLWTWADVTSRQRLVDGRLPLPAVAWEGAPVGLEVRPRMLPDRTDGRETMLVRYRARNDSPARRTGSLLIAVRPFQGNPPAQFLNRLGGVAALPSVRMGEARVVELDTLSSISFVPRPSGFGATTFDAGEVAEHLASGRVPERHEARDAEGLASAAMAWDFDLAPGESLVVEVHATVRDPATRGPFALGPPWPEDEADARVVAGWRAAIGPAEVRLPPSAREVERSLAAQIGWIQVNRDGPSIKPGSRAYDRSWIRDGSLTCSALLRWGRHEEVRAFLEWFAPYQYADGKVPCCVDGRGSDPVPEHDSHGQFIYLAAEYFRHTGDRATIERLWPHVAAAAAYLDTLRAQRLGPEWRTPDRAEFLGILPPSISHEGYSAKAMHSYWDDFFAVRGYDDAAFLARALGRPADARRIAASGAAFRRDFAASIRAAMKRHRIAYIPGSADLGDFDATSTTVALAPVQAADLAPRGAIEATFERYWDFFTKRRDGRERWEAFTPYEVRTIGAFVRLGWRERAHELVEWFLGHRAPSGWAQWSEIVWNDPPGARFLGDIPHTWVGSDFVRSILDMLAYERERDDALVVGAGVPERWVREADGVAVRDLDTWHGPLSYRLRARGAGIEVAIEKGTRVPRGGIVVAAPGVTPRWRAMVNGRRATVTARGEVVVRALPAEVVLEP